MDSNTRQLLLQFQRNLADARTQNAMLRGQIAQLTSQYARLINAVGYTNEKNAALTAQLRDRISLPPSFTPRMGGDPDQQRFPIVSTRSRSSKFGRIQFGRSRWEAEDIAPSDPLFDEDYD